MAFSPIAFVAPNYRDYKNYWLKAYEPGTTTPKYMATDSNLVTLISKAELNADGFIVSAGGALIVPYIDGAYDLYLFPKEVDADNNDTSSALRVADNIRSSIGAEDSSQDYVFDTVSSLKSSTISFPVGKKLTTSNYYTGVVGGGANYIKKTTTQASADGDIIDGYGNHTLADGTVAIIQPDNDGSNSALQYGAKVGILNDSYLQLTAFLNGVKKANFARSDFYVSQTVVFDNNNLAIDALGYTASNIITLAGFTGTHILESHGFGLKLNNIGFVGDGGAFGTGATIKAIKLQRSDSTGNTDSFITGCTFYRMLDCIDTFGRNTVIKNNNFNTSLRAVTQNLSPEGETRGLVISDNNFHSMGIAGTPATCIVVSSAAFGNKINDNMGDGSIYNFYSGPTQGSEMSNNIINTLVNDGIVSQGSTYVGLPLAGIVTDNTLSKGAPSYTGTCIKGQFNNTTIDNNACIGSAEHGIHISSGGGNKVTSNIILSHDYNETGNFDGIKCEGSSNLVESNHIRSAGKVTVNSAIDMASSAGILGNNFIDSAYVTPFGRKSPDFQLNAAGAGFGINPTTDLHVAGYESKITSPDAIKASPVTRSAEHTGASGVFAGSEFKSVVISSAVGNEAVDCRMTVNNRTVIEDRIIALFDGGMGLQSPDGTWYKLQPPNGGGSISWVAAPYVP